MDNADSASASRFLVHDLFPTNEFHIIYGPARAGKTTLMLQIADDWSHSRDVFGLRSYPAPFVFVTATKTRGALNTHMARLGINGFPYFALVNYAKNHEERNLSHILAHARHLVPSLRVLFIDGLSAICPKRLSDHSEVMQFMLDTVKVCQSQAITIIGTLTTAKAREGQDYTSPLERLLGSGAFSDGSNCKILIDHPNPRKTSDASRLIYLMPADLPMWEQHAKFSSEGSLKMIERQVFEYALDQWLTEQAPESIITRQQILDVAADDNLSRATADRWTDNQCELGSLLRTSRGKYKVNVTTPNQ